MVLCSELWKGSEKHNPIPAVNFKISSVKSALFQFSTLSFLYFLAHNYLLHLFIGCSNGLETAALPLSPFAANLLLTVVLLIIFSRMALIYD
jgi:hypothetical protein